MNSFSLLLATLSCLVFTTSVLSRMAPSTNSPLERRDDVYGIKMPGETWDGLATSYDYNTYGKYGGACGWTIGGGLDMIPSTIRGSAQQIGYFGNGLACGTCVEITPTDRSLPTGAPPNIVTVLNSCPGTCHSIDIESEVVTSWFGSRLGQFNMRGKVVPCGYLKEGITIQYRQITNNPYDFRMNFRLSSGAVRYAEVSLPGRWLPLKRSNPSQFVLEDQSKAHDVLSQEKFALRFTNHKGETIVQEAIPNLVGKSGFGEWQKTNVNFQQT